MAHLGTSLSWRTLYCMTSGHDLHVGCCGHLLQDRDQVGSRWKAYRSQIWEYWGFWVRSTFPVFVWWQYHLPHRESELQGSWLLICVDFLLSMSFAMCNKWICVLTNGNQLVASLENSHATAATLDWWPWCKHYTEFYAIKEKRHGWDSPNERYKREEDTNSILVNYMWWRVCIFMNNHTPVALKKIWSNGI